MASVEDDHDIKFTQVEDPIIRRFPIYMSSALAPHITLLQYPVHGQAPDVPEGIKGKISTRYKPQAEKLELTIPISTHHNMYDGDRAEVLGIGAQAERDREHGKRKREDFQAPRLEHWKLSSTKIPAQTVYMCGTMRSDGLHLHPVQSTLQLRPSLSYLDAMDTMTSADDEVIDDAPAKAINIAVKPGLSGQFNAFGGAGGLSARANLMKPLRDEEEEGWEAVGWKDRDSAKGAQLYSQLFTKNSTVLENHSKVGEWLK